MRGDFYVFACSISVIILLRKTVLFDNEHGTVRYVFVMPRTSAHNLQYVWRRRDFSCGGGGAREIVMGVHI